MSVHKPFQVGGLALILSIANNPPQAMNLRYRAVTELLLPCSAPREPMQLLESMLVVALVVCMPVAVPSVESSVFAC